MHGLGEGAQVQADHGVFQPALHARDMVGSVIRIQGQRIGGRIKQDEIGCVIGHGA
jgi:hypothetical protein